jgi:signal peptidase II
VTDTAPSRATRYVLVAVVFAATLWLDLWSKQWAWDTLRDGEPVTVIEHVFYLNYGFNTGAAFSLFRDAEWARAFFIVMTFVALLYMGWLLKTMPTKRAYGFAAVAMIAAGAVGNLHDRFVRVDTVSVNGKFSEHHGVVDFLQFYYQWEGAADCQPGFENCGAYWPIFNVADSGLVAGVFLLLIFLHYQGKEDAAAEAAAQAQTT